MGLPASSNMSSVMPRNTAPQNSMTNMSGLMQMLGMLRQLRAANGGQSPFGGKGAARTQPAAPMQRAMMPMPMQPQSMFQMPQPAPFVPVQQQPRVVPPMASVPPAAAPGAPVLGPLSQMYQKAGANVTTSGWNPDLPFNNDS